MTKNQSILSVLLCLTPIQYFPVRVRRGMAAGAKWTFLPFSTLWRHGGEMDIDAAADFLGDIRGANCWDLGAHFGIHTVGLAMQVGPGGQVAAFEPDPVSFRRLARHVRMNRLDNVHLFNAAISDRSSRAQLNVSDGRGAMTSHLAYDQESVGDDTQRIEVETVCADLLVEQGRLFRPDFIKVDIQGHGAKALAGALVSIEKGRPLVLFSNHSQEEADGIRRLLQPLGYELLSVEGKRIPWNSLESLDHISVILDPRRSF